MRLFLVTRRSTGLHLVRVFSEPAGAAADYEAETMRRVGYQAKVFLAEDLADVVRTHPSWFAESPLPVSGEVGR